MAILSGGWFSIAYDRTDEKLISSLKYHARVAKWYFDSHIGNGYLQFSRSGIRWTAPRRDRFISPSLYIQHGWQCNEINAALGWLHRTGATNSQRNIIVTAGAHIGSTAIHFATQSHYRILAIEPVEEHFELLKRNVSDNNLSDRIFCHKAAVYDSEKEVMLAVPRSNTGAAEICSHAHSNTYGDRWGPAKLFSSIAKPLNSILREEEISCSQVALVWADIQGCEGHLIRSARKLWEFGVPLVMEFWPDGLKSQQERDLISTIRAHFEGFSMFPTPQSSDQGFNFRPTSELEESIVGDREEVDLLLLPRLARRDS